MGGSCRHRNRNRNRNRTRGSIGIGSRNSAVASCVSPMRSGMCDRVAARRQSRRPETPGKEGSPRPDAVRHRWRGVATGEMRFDTAGAASLRAKYRARWVTTGEAFTGTLAWLRRVLPDFFFKDREKGGFAHAGDMLEWGFATFVGKVRVGPVLKKYPDHLPILPATLGGHM